MRISIRFAAVVAAVALPGGVCAQTVEAPAVDWPGGFLPRVEVLALMQTLNAALLSSRSATATLEKWCADHKLAPEPRIVAHRVMGADKPPSAETRARLAVAEGESVAYRHVALSCGAHVLSEADNWYVPGRLSPDMNRTLETTDTPFGKAVAALQPFRRTIEMKMRFTPLPEGWELGAGGPESEKPGPLTLPHALFEHTAVLYADQRPFSEVHETYTNELLDFGPASARPPGR
jgi:chorismate-pyruvate lyase